MGGDSPSGDLDIELLRSEVPSRVDDLDDHGGPGELALVRAAALAHVALAIHGLVQKSQLVALAALDIRPTSIHQKKNESVLH